jgi:predicted protein tyrosine phosphatase
LEGNAAIDGSGCPETATGMPWKEEGMRSHDSPQSRPTGPTLAQLDEGVAWVREQTAQGRRVLVHCAHGHGRSAAVLAVLLLAEGVVGSVGEAEALMRAVRPRVRLNARQRAGAEAWAALRLHKQR